MGHDDRADAPRHLADRLRGHAHPASDLLVTRLPGSRYVYVGLAHGGYVRLRLRQARELGFLLLELAGGPPTVEDDEG